MAWPNPFYRVTPQTRTCWGYRFEMTESHITEDECRPLRQSYDVMGERVWERLNAMSPPPSKDLPRNATRHSAASRDPVEVSPEGEDTIPKPARRDLYALLVQNAEHDDLLQQFWTQINTVPAWVDWDQIQRGQDVFYRYGGACLTGLAYHSLLGGMGAARVVETLARTGGFSTKVARMRLFETTQHILQCTKSLESMQPGGDGFASTIRVRLLHAAVRRRILRLASTRSGYYDVDALGVPINDLDSMATIVTFSASLIWISLPRQGIYLRRQEIVDYVALWRYIAHVIGSPTDHFATPERAKMLMESLLLYEIQPTKTSRILANNIIRSLERQPPGYASADFLSASARWLNGNELSDALDLPRPGLYYWALMAGQNILFCFLCYTNRMVPSWDRRKIELLKRVFYNIIVHSKYGLQGEETTFEFKHVPEFSTVTELGESWEDRIEHSDVERRNLKAFAAAVGVLGIASWLSLRLLGRVISAVVG